MRRGELLDRIDAWGRARGSRDGRGAALAAMFDSNKGGCEMLGVRTITVVVLGAGLLGAGPAPLPPVPASCPPHPVRVVHSVGAAVEYGSTYPGIADLCSVRRGGSEGYFYFGIWRIDWPGAGLAYPAIKTALTGASGTRTEFVTRSYPGLQWRDAISNEGTETLVVDGTRYATVRLAHEREGIEGNTYHSIITSWRDIRTGVTLKTVENQISGQSYGPDTTWTAVRVQDLSREPAPGSP